MRSYFEDFQKHYNQPRVDNIIVGFSGIDPTPKSVLEEPIFGSGKVISIERIECGEITLDSDETDTP